VPPLQVGVLFVVDISLGGVGIWAQGRPPFEAGQRVILKLRLGHAAPLDLGAVVRYTRGPDKSFCGMKFDELDDEQRAAVGRYVGELVERGSLV